MDVGCVCLVLGRNGFERPIPLRVVILGGHLIVRVDVVILDQVMVNCLCHLRRDRHISMFGLEHLSGEVGNVSFARARG
jgi:hypothetical protein